MVRSALFQQPIKPAPILCRYGNGYRETGVPNDMKEAPGQSRGKLDVAIRTAMRRLRRRLERRGSFAALHGGTSFPRP